VKTRVQKFFGVGPSEDPGGLSMLC